MSLTHMQWSEPNLDPINSSSISTPTIKNHSVTHHSNHLYCFGGYDGRRNHMTLMIFSIQTQQWHPAKHISGTPPPGRNGHTATLAVGEDKIMIIGGWLGVGPLAASDTHVLDVSNGPDKLRWFQPTPRGNPPGPCNMHSADYIPSTKEVFVFRGGNGREYLNDLHALHVSSYEWRTVLTTGCQPQARANHSSAVLPSTNELFIFGGWNGRERLNDVHILDIGCGVWSRADVGGELPHPRAGMTLTVLGDKLFLFGGSGTSRKCFNDLQILDRSEMKWLDVTVEEEESGGGHGAERRRNQLAVRYAQSSGGFASRSTSAGGGAGGGQLAAYARSSSSRQCGYSQECDVDDSDEAYRKQTDDWHCSSTHNPSSTNNNNNNSNNDMMSLDAANPKDEDSHQSISVHGLGPGRRAGHTATAVNRYIYIFGGSCGSDYLNDFFMLDTDPPPIANCILLKV